MSETAVKDAISYLQKVDTTAKSSIYEQLTNLVTKVLDERPTHPVDLLETALLIKKTTTNPCDTQPTVPPSAAADAHKAVALLNLFGTPDVPIDPESGDPVEVEPPNEYECEDILGDAALFEALGVGLPKSEMLRVSLAAKALGQDPKKGVATARFFGKFFGTHGDYYVFETTLVNPPEGEPEQNLPEGVAPSESNAGANAFVYWVCSYPGGPWSQLPGVTPTQVKAARQLKKLLTGRLSSEVSSYPVFPGTEANYLRALIARISCTTVAAPVGMFAANEEGGIDKAEEFTPLPAREMGASANWCHRTPHLKRQGRCELFKREPPEGEEDTWQPSEEEAEEGPEPLAPLEGDATLATGEAAWTPLFSSSAEHVKYQVAGLRSNLWPGAACACQGHRFSNIYVGWGLKNAPFVPLPPPPVAKEFDAALVESSELPPKPAPPADEGDAADE